jgi:hypothetical protein
MALVITGGNAGSAGSGTAGVTGAYAIVSGALGGATVDFYASDGTGAPAPVFTATAPCAVKLALASGVKVAVAVHGGQLLSSVDVSIT